MLLVPLPSARWTTRTLVAGQIDAGVISLDLRVLPGLDGAHEDARQHFRRQLDRGLQRGQVVDDRDRASALGICTMGAMAARAASFRGASEAPKSTVPALTC